MMHLLVVDDHSDIRLIYSRILRDAGYEVHAARDGAEAMEDVEKHPPALILLDVFMPIMNGVEFLEQLRQRSAHSDIPVVLMSAVPDNPEVSYARELGVSKFLRKGDFDLSQLVTTVKETLAKQPN
jgi:CheY-like chemotaxis protein